MDGRTTHVWALAWAMSLGCLLSWTCRIAAADGDRCRGACGHATTYAVAEALFMQRDNAATPQPLVIDSDTDTSVIDADRPRFDGGPGVRVFLGRQNPCSLGWEVGYTGIYGMFAREDAVADGTLDITPPLSVVPGLRNASLADVEFASSLQMAEASVLLTSHSVRLPRESIYPAERCRREFTFDWLAGFRWAGFQDQASISLSEAAVTDTYRVRTTSNLFGGQLGLRGRIAWERWALEGWMKAALAGAALSQSQDPIVDAITGLDYRSARGAHADEVGGIFDLNATLIRRINDTWGLRVGYNSLWLSGLALAPDQFDFSTADTAGTSIVTGKTAWLQGVSLGLEARW